MNSTRVTTTHQQKCIAWARKPPPPPPPVLLKSFGFVLLLLLFFCQKDPYEQIGGDFLGEAQWGWLEATLRESTARSHIFISSLQLLVEVTPAAQSACCRCLLPVPVRMALTPSLHPPRAAPRQTPGPRESLRVLERLPGGPGAVFGSPPSPRGQGPRGSVGRRALCRDLAGGLWQWCGGAATARGVNHLWSDARVGARHGKCEEGASINPVRDHGSFSGDLLYSNNATRCSRAHVDP